MSTDLVNLAQTILANYNVEANSIKVIQSGGIKTVWKIATNNGSCCLKRLRQTLNKALFTINAQNYMAQKGAKVPAIYPTKKEELYCLLDDQLFVLYQWVEGKNVYLDNPADLEQALYGIADFHRDSAGYHSPDGCEVSSKLGRWPHYYASLLNRLREWKEIAANSPQLPLSRVFLANVDHSIGLGEKALAILGQSHYNKWVSKVEEQKCLCHQDYGDGNAIAAPDGVYVIDLDGVTYDLPVRDLRKIINKRMSTAGKWNKELLNSIIRWYGKVNPLTKEQLHVLYVDLLFPHEFHDTAKNPYRKNKPIDASKLVKAAKLEQFKEEALVSLLD